MKEEGSKERLWDKLFVINTDISQPLGVIVKVKNEARKMNKRPTT